MGGCFLGGKSWDMVGFFGEELFISGKKKQPALNRKIK